MSKQPKFVIYEDAAYDWRWRLVAANGRIIADSAEGYVTRSGVIRAIRAVCHTVATIEEVPQ